MRVFSYILTALVTIFIFNIVLSFSLPVYRDALVQVRTSIFPVSEKISEDDIAEEKKSENARLVESLDRIDKHIESLSETQKTDTGVVTMSGMVNTGTILTSSASGVVVPEVESIPVEPSIPLSGLFLSKIMPEITPKKVENSWFFGIQVMGKIFYNTYSDEKKQIKIYAFNDTYDTLLLNMKLTSSVYSLNETDQFFGYTFFLNPLKKDPKDTLVRFITALEGRAIGVEVPKEYYTTLKKMLLKNK
ncbi:MAG: hypothetical protein ACD_78C00101G0005 [uncultured bacterium (gcode 4)]|uniref:Uncharacterized protein n=1 Tax=uncultured bacterium (gcode 4) TaxID=1234023 RepID=K1XIU8_9BACT|nr:MAG: hypothetical protein ACD_78C00101G0005 [uncultured bacterium (gcode 4)]